MLLRQQPYNDLGADYVDNLSHHIRARRLLKQLQTLGYEVEVKPLSDVS